MEEKYIWVFHGAGGKFASAVFDVKEKAEAWIENNNLEGILTVYPLNYGVYDWALENEYFSPKNLAQSSPEFIQRFSSASLEHYHYDNED